MPSLEFIIINNLLNKTYLTREIYEGKQVIGKINADYRFIERYITLFEGYLNVINYTLTIDEELGVVYLSNEYGYNKMHLDKLTTLVLFTLRTIYDEAWSDCNHSYVYKHDEKEKCKYGIKEIN